jgi:hypothetical protein
LEGPQQRQQRIPRLHGLEPAQQVAAVGLQGRRKWDGGTGGVQTDDRREQIMLYVYGFRVTQSLEPKIFEIEIELKLKLKLKILTIFDSRN